MESIGLIRLIGHIWLIGIWRPHGTGSYPLPPHGWQRSRRLMASQSPFTGPCFSIAWRAYSEHVGVKRHEGGVNGDMQRW